MKTPSAPSSLSWSWGQTVLTILRDMILVLMEGVQKGLGALRSGSAAVSGATGSLAQAIAITQNIDSQAVLKAASTCLQGNSTSTP